MKSLPAAPGWMRPAAFPSVDDLQTFFASKDPNKRDKLIDKLVSSDAFVDRWAFYFEDLFRAGGRMGSGLNLFHFWIREWLSLDRPYNEVVTDLLTGAGQDQLLGPGRNVLRARFREGKGRSDCARRARPGGSARHGRRVHDHLQQGLPRPEPGLHFLSRRQRITSRR